MTTEINLSKKTINKKLQSVSWIIFLIGLVLSILAFFIDKERSIRNYNLIFTILVSIGIGNLFLVALEYLSGAIWSTVIRRIPELFSSLIPILALVGIFVLTNTHSIFHWAYSEAVQNDKILQLKSPYLNQEFLIIRYFVFFALWFAFYKIIINNSVNQDLNGDVKFTKSNSKWSAVFMPVFAFTLTFFSIDYIMSTEPHWYSTIFGVYYFSGTVLAALTTVTLSIVLLHENGFLGNILKSDHFHNLGALLFAFVNFWAYIAFSQFLLIWYANLPEESFWMINRWKNGWEIFSFILIFGHFLIPYFALLSQQAKSNLDRLKFISAWIFLMHYVDLYWLMMPSFYKELTFGWIEMSYFILMIGFLFVFFINRFNRLKNLIPINDPKLKRSLEFHL